MLQSLRGSYDSFTPEEKATIAKKAIENGVTKTVVKYNRELQDRTLKELLYVCGCRITGDNLSCIDVQGLNYHLLCQNLKTKKEDNLYFWVRSLISTHACM